MRLKPLIIFALSLLLLSRTAKSTDLVSIGTITPITGQPLVIGGNLNIYSGYNLQIGGTEVISSGRIIKAADGGAGAPAFAFSSDTNTGIYRRSEDVLSIATGGVERFNISTTAIQSTLPLAMSGQKITGLAQGTASGEAIHAGRAINTPAGSGLTGGGDLTADRSLSIAWGTDLIGWGNLTAYPAACPSGQAVQGVGDTLSCIAVDTNPGDDITGSGTATQVAFFTGSNTIGSDSNLYWDN
ncbi:MAG: hypothetical protein QXL86_03795, partial [Candidatus Aenigmatarchaeota archaeon]